MNCIRCDGIIDEEKMACEKCNKNYLHCTNCNYLVMEDDVYCGNCGNDITQLFKTNDELQKENEIFEFSKNLIIDNEGNKFKSIKELKEKYDFDNEVATEYINNALKSFDDIPDTKKVESNKQQIENKVNLDPKGISKVMIIGQSSKKKATSVVSRGIVGGMLLGPVGLLAGASGKNKNKTTFLIIYNSGKRETLTVKNNGLLYNKLIQFVE